MKGFSSIILLLATIVFATAAEEETGNIRGLQISTPTTDAKDALKLAEAVQKTANDVVTASMKLVMPAVGKLASAVTILGKANTAHITLIAKMEVKNYETSMLNLEKLSVTMMAEKLRVDVVINDANVAMSKLVTTFEQSAQARGNVASILTAAITDPAVKAAKIAENCKLVCVLPGAYDPTKAYEIPQTYALESSVKASQASIAQCEALKLKVEQFREEMKIINAEAAVKIADAEGNVATYQVIDFQTVFTAAEVKYNAALAVYNAAVGEYTTASNTLTTAKNNLAATKVKISTANALVATFVKSAGTIKDKVTAASDAAEDKVSDAGEIGCVSTVCKRPAGFTPTLEIFPATNFLKGLVRYYPFDGNTIDGISGVAARGAYGYNNEFGADRFGNVNSAFSFLDNNRYLQTSALNLPTGERTVSVWVKVASFAHTNSILGYGGGNCGRSLYFQMTRSSLSATWYCGYYGVNGAITDKENVWTHLAYTASEKGGGRVFMNGVLVGSYAQFVKDTPVVDGRVLVIGATLEASGYGMTFDGSWFQGLMDDLRIFDIALSDSEILRLYNMPK